MSPTVLGAQGHESITEEILAFLPWRDVLSASATCTNINRVVADSARLQLALRKVFYGIESVPDRPGAPGPEVQRLIDIQRRWATLDPKRIDIIPTEEMHGAAMATSDGFLVLPTHSRNAPPKIYPYGEGPEKHEPIGDGCTVYDLRALRDASLEGAPKWKLAFGFEYDSIAVNASDGVIAVCQLSTRPGGGPDEASDNKSDGSDDDEDDPYGWTVERTVHFFCLTPGGETGPEPHPAAAGPIMNTEWMETYDNDDDEDARVNGRWEIELRAGGVLAISGGLKAVAKLFNWKSGDELLDAKINMLHIEAAHFVPVDGGMLAVSRMPRQRGGQDLWRDLTGLGITGLAIDAGETHHGSGGTGEAIGLNPPFRTDALFWTDAGGVREDGPVRLPREMLKYAARPILPLELFESARNPFLCRHQVAGDGKLLAITANSSPPGTSYVAIIRVDRLRATFEDSVRQRTTNQEHGRQYTDHLELDLDPSYIDWDFRSFSRSAAGVAGLRSLQATQVGGLTEMTVEEIRVVLHTAQYAFDAGADVVHERPLGTIGASAGTVALASTVQRAEPGDKQVTLSEPWDDTHRTGETISTPVLAGSDKPPREVWYRANPSAKDGVSPPPGEEYAHFDRAYKYKSRLVPQEYETTRGLGRPGTAVELLFKPELGDVERIRMDSERAYLLFVSGTGYPCLVVLSF